MKKNAISFVSLLSIIFLFSCGGNKEAILNKPPQAKITGNSNYYAGDTVTLYALLSNDPENRTITYKWQQLQGTNVLTGIDTTASQIMFKILQSGFYIFKLTVRDDLREGYTDSITITVADSPPIIVITNDTSNIICDTYYLSAALSSAPSGRQLNDTWQIISQPDSSNVTLSSLNSETISFYPIFAGDYVLRLRVSDGLSASETDVRITIANPAPSVKGFISGSGAKIFDGPNFIKINSAGDRAYITNLYGAFFHIIDLNLNTVLDRISIKSIADILDINNKRNKLYIACKDQKELQIYNTNTGNLTSINLNIYPYYVKVSELNDMVYVTSDRAGTNVMQVINCITDTIIATLTFNGSSAANMALTPDEKQLLVISNLPSGNQGYIRIVDTLNSTLTDTIINIGQSIKDIQISSDGKYAFITYNYDYICVVNLKSYSIEKIISNDIAKTLSNIALGSRFYLDTGLIYAISYSLSYYGLVLIDGKNEKFDNNSVYGKVASGLTNGIKGIDVSPDGRQIYITDSVENKIYHLSY